MAGLPFPLDAARRLTFREKRGTVPPVKSDEREKYPPIPGAERGRDGVALAGKEEKAPWSRGAEMCRRSPPLLGKSADQPDPNSGGTAGF